MLAVLAVSASAVSALESGELVDSTQGRFQEV